METKAVKYINFHPIFKWGSSVLMYYIYKARIDFAVVIFSGFYQTKNHSWSHILTVRLELLNWSWRCCKAYYKLRTFYEQNTVCIEQMPSWHCMSKCKLRRTFRLHRKRQSLQTDRARAFESCIWLWNITQTLLNTCKCGDVYNYMYYFVWIWMYKMHKNEITQPNLKCLSRSYLAELHCCTECIHIIAVHNCHQVQWWYNVKCSFDVSYDTKLTRPISHLHQ